MYHIDKPQDILYYILASLILKKGGNLLKTVIKRDGTNVDFDRSKIVVALQKANDAVEENERITDSEIEEIADFITDKKKQRILVEDIQDMVECKLM